MKRIDAPIVRYLNKAQLSKLDVAYHSGVSLATIDKMCRDDNDLLRMKMGTLMQVSMCLGCAAVELFPDLGKRPSTGLLWDRRVFVPKKTR